VKLADGSLVMLNTDTSIKVRVDWPATHVDVLRGEVFFRTEERLPGHLIVAAGGIDIGERSGGFSVRLTTPGNVRVTVAEGEVRLSGGVGALLERDQQATVDLRRASPDVSIRNMSPEEIDRELSWMEGELVFNGARLADVVQEINRYNLTRIEVMDRGVGERLIGGSFSATDPFAFVTSVVKVYAGIRWACERGVSGTLVLRLRQARSRTGRGPESPGCASMTFAAASAGAAERD
jgi:transmembrane sensor